MGHSGGQFLESRVNEPREDWSVQSAKLNDTILELYRGCRDVSVSEFKDWAMQAANKALSFDSGLWSTSNVVSNDFSTMYLHRLPWEMIENYRNVLQAPNDPLAMHALANPGTTIRPRDVMPMNKWKATPAYLNHCVPFSIFDALCTLIISPHSHVPNVISFYRGKVDDEFSESDRQSAAALVPHLIEAMRINLFANISLNGSFAGKAIAIIDRFGQIFESTPHFDELMRDVLLKTQSPQLPIPDTPLDPDRDARWSDRDLLFHVQPHADLFRLDVVVDNPLNTLSTRQLEIALLLGKGRRYKDIARQMGISPSTVTNHVNQIHARLQIAQREELVALVTAFESNRSK